MKKMNAKEYFESTPIGFINRINKGRGFVTKYTKNELISFAEAYLKYHKEQDND